MRKSARLESRSGSWRQRLWRGLPLVPSFTPLLAQSQAGLCEREMMRASAKYGVPLGMLYSVGLTETGRRGSLQPYAMNVEGKAVFSNSAAEAIQHFEAGQPIRCKAGRSRLHADQPSLSSRELSVPGKHAESTH